jgi:hypothetical protein
MERRMKLDDALKVSLDELRMQMLGAQVLLGFEFQGLFQDGFAKVSLICRSVDAVGLGNDGHRDRPHDCGALSAPDRGRGRGERPYFSDIEAVCAVVAVALLRTGWVTASSASS